MSSMVMYRSNSDHNVVRRDIWFCIKRNLDPFLVTFRSLLANSEVPKVPTFFNILVAALLCVDSSIQNYVSDRHIW